LYRTRLAEGGAAHGAFHVVGGEGVLNEVTLQLGRRFAQCVAEVTLVNVA